MTGRGLAGRYVLRMRVFAGTYYDVWSATAVDRDRRVMVQVLTARGQGLLAEAGIAGNPLNDAMRIAIAGRDDRLLRHLQAGTTSDGFHYAVQEVLPGSNLGSAC